MPVSFIRPHTLHAWKGASLLIVDTHGRCGLDEPLSGYYFREARFLRTLRFEIDGEAPWLCEATTVAPSMLAFTYVHPELSEYGGGGSGQAGDDVPTNKQGIPQRALAIRTSYLV